MNLANPSLKPPTFWGGAAAALMFAAVAALLLPALSLLFGGWLAVKIGLSLIAAGYAAYLMTAAQSSTARLAASVAWIAVAAVGFFFASSVVTLAVPLLLITWMIRAAYFRSGMVDSLLDLGLVLLGAAAAAGALINTGSTFLSVWTFFLVQALHTAIPGLHGAAAQSPAADGRRFNQALRSAEAALRRIHSQPTI